MRNRDTSWIKPGKVIREITLTDAGAEACLDFAVEHNFQYVEFDAGWYGHEYDDASDATTITLDPKRSKGPLDLRGFIDRANERGIGVILYVNRRCLERQLDEILPLFKEWGVKGVKYGFVRVGSQEHTSWLHDAIRKAAEHELLVDVHDEYRPTGYSRTYPNLLTQEGVRGDEAGPSAEQNAHHRLHAFARRGVGLYRLLLHGAGCREVDPRAPTGKGGLHLQPVAVPVLVRHTARAGGALDQHEFDRANARARVLQADADHLG